MDLYPLLVTDGTDEGHYPCKDRWGNRKAEGQSSELPDVVVCGEAQKLSKAFPDGNVEVSIFEIH